MGEMPRDLSEEAVARWLHGENHTYIRDTLGEWGRTWDAASPDERTGEEVRNVYRNLARAVLALVRAKVREAVVATTNRQEVCVPLSENTFTIRDETDDEVVARVMGEEVRRG